MVGSTLHGGFIGGVPISDLCELGQAIAFSDLSRGRTTGQVDEGNASQRDREGAEGGDEEREPLPLSGREGYYWIVPHRRISEDWR